jgi:hypothetical protein
MKSQRTIEEARLQFFGFGRNSDGQAEDQKEKK